MELHSKCFGSPDNGREGGSAMYTGCPDVVLVRSTITEQLVSLWCHLFWVVFHIC